MLKDKVLLITGAGRGIGRIAALDAARAGAAIVVNDPGVDRRGDTAGCDEGPAQDVAAEIVAAGGRAIADTGSVTSWVDAQAMVARAVTAFGRMDGVVNNAGILRDGLFHKMPVEDFLSVVSVHLIGSFHVARAAAPLFREQGSGAFVHMTSTSGLIGNVGQANYAAAKAGIIGLSKSIALDMARFSVRSNCIAPFAWSRLTDTIPVRDAASEARVRRMQAMKPEQVAPLIVALMSDQAADISGQVFIVRGNEIFLSSQMRPVRGLHADGGWTPETIRSRALPALRSSMAPLETSPEIFCWDPV
jgi:NAD(P)-dependent dehydrogenase (short-subunit alcohol dehydrogenase family)